jgi:hypothetical protein
MKPEDDFFNNKRKKPELEEVKQKCSIRGGYCDNHEIMKNHFSKHGNMEDCAGCCAMCVNTNSCEFVCDCCKPATVLAHDLSALKRFMHRDKTFFILEDKDNSGKYAAYFSIGDSEAIRLGTLRNAYDTPQQAEKALESFANLRGYEEIKAKSTLPKAAPESTEPKQSFENNQEQEQILKQNALVVSEKDDNPPASNAQTTSPKAPTMPKEKPNEMNRAWINVNQQLPEIKKLVLLYGGKGWFGIGWYEGETNGFKHWYIETDENAEHRSDFVRWWMTLPNIPDDL